MDKVTRQCPQTTTFLKRKESRSGIEPRSFRLPAYRLTVKPNRLFPLAATDRTTISGPRPRKEESAWAIFFIFIFQQHSSSGLSTRVPMAYFIITISSALQRSRHKAIFSILRRVVLGIFRFSNNRLNLGPALWTRH